MERGLATVRALSRNDGLSDEDETISARTCCTRKVRVGTLLLFLFPWRSYGPASAHATVDVLLFLLRWFQNLGRHSISLNFEKHCQWRYSIAVFGTWAGWAESSLPGMNITSSHQRSSWRLRCRTLHSNSVH